MISFKSCARKDSVRMAGKLLVVEVVSFTASPDRLRTPMTMCVLFDLNTVRLTYLSGTFNTLFQIKMGFHIGFVLLRVLFSVSLRNQQASMAVL